MTLPINPYLHLDPSKHTFQERTGASATTVAEPGDPVGSWKDDASGLWFVAATDNGRPTLVKENGQYYLRFNGAQFLKSSDAASTWAFFNDGTTKFSVGLQFRPNVALLAGTEIYVLLSTGTSSSAAKGIDLFFDNRSASSRWRNWRAQVNVAAAGNPCVDATFDPGLQVRRWTPLVCAFDLGASGYERVMNWAYESRCRTGNVETQAAAAGDPAAALTIGGSNGGTTFLTTGDIGEIVVYKRWLNPARLQACWDALNRDDLRRWVATAIADVGAHDAVDGYTEFPVIVENQLGQLLVMYRRATAHSGVKGTLSRAISSDGGDTWENEDDVIDHATDDLREPVLHVRPNGTILVASDRQTGAGPTVGNGIVYRSTDHGQSFSEVVTMTPPAGYDWVFPWGNMYEIPGKILMGCYFQVTASGEFRPGVMESDDDGDTWALRSEIGVDTATEPTFVNLGDGNWLALMRFETVPRPIYYALSDDDMETWGTPAVIEGVIPDTKGEPHLIEVAGDIFCLTARRGQASYDNHPGICLMRYHLGKWDTAGRGSLMIEPVGNTAQVGRPTAVVRGDTIHMVHNDINDIGIKYRRYRYLRSSQLWTVDTNNADITAAQGKIGIHSSKWSDKLAV